MIIFSYFSFFTVGMNCEKSRFDSDISYAQPTDQPKHFPPLFNMVVAQIIVVFAENCVRADKKNFLCQNVFFIP
jgi:hypothetical protein